MLGIFFEFFADVFLEGMISGAGNPKKPMWLRLLLLGVPCGLLTAVAGFWFAEMLRHRGLPEILIVGAILLAIILLWFFLCRKIIKSRR